MKQINSKNMVGKKFGQLIVVKKKRRINNGKAKWWCVCSCGKIKAIDGTSLRTGRTKSCGCLQRIAARKTLKTHGMTGTKAYRAWKAMMSRCYNENVKCYCYYGGRGIFVDNSWHDFKRFYKDMGDPPSSKHEIDRINTDNEYASWNCRWVDRIVNVQNRRNVKLNKKIVRQMRSMFSNGTKIADIAKHFDVSWSVSCKAIHGHSWSNVK